MTRWVLLLLSLWGLLILPGCPRDFALPGEPGGGDRFQLSLITATPSVLREGVELVVVFGAADFLDRDSCQADLGGAPLLCDAAFENTCTCRRSVGNPAERPEGDVVLSFSATNVNGEGEGVETLWVDHTPPDIDGAVLGILRTPVGDDDQVLIPAGAITEQGPTYPDAGVVEVRIWTSETASNPRVAIMGALPGDLLDIGGTSGNPQLAPTQVWVSALDRAGNESPKVRISIGEDLNPPVIDPTGLELEVPVSGASVVRSQPSRNDVITDAISAPLRVELFEDATGQQPLGTAVIETGGFLDVAASSRLERVYLRAVDKCGNTSTLVEARRVVADIDPSTASPASVALFDGDATLDPASLSLAALRSTATARAASTALDAEDAERLITAVDPLIQTPASWVDASPTTPPIGFQGARLEWDPIRQVMVMVGEVGIGMETWIHDGSDWALATPTTSPPYRWDFGMAWSQALGGMVLFGGFDDTNPLGDTWLWNGSDWSLLSPTGAPPARRGHVMARDPVRDVIVLFGGEDATGGLSETWEFDGASWNQITTSTTPPWPRYTAMAYHDLLGVMVLFGGGSFRNQLTWYYANGDWSRPTLAIEPPGRLRSAMAYDAMRQVMVLFGGDQQANNRSGDTWELSASGWLLASPASSPEGRLLHAMGYDRGRQRVMLLGGSIDNTGNPSTTWEYTPTATPGPRWAFQLLDFSTDAPVHPEEFFALYVVAGEGDPDSDGTPDPRITGYVWDPTGATWALIGSHVGPNTALPSGRRLDLPPSRILTTYADNGVVTFLVAAPASSGPPQTVPSTVFGDHLSAQVTYTRP